MKAFASDFDGTFYFVDQKEPIKQCDIEAIGELQSKGYLFGFCTGRPIYGVLDYLDNQVMADFYITKLFALLPPTAIFLFHLVFRLSVSVSLPAADLTPARNGLRKNLSFPELKLL